MTVTLALTLQDMFTIIMLCTTLENFSMIFLQELSCLLDLPAKQISLHMQAQVIFTTKDKTLKICWQ